MIIIGKFRVQIFNQFYVVQTLGVIVTCDIFLLQKWF